MAGTRLNRRAVLLGVAFAGAGLSQSRQEKQARVADAERRFAATMALRDARAFASFVSEEAVFVGDDEGKRVFRGRRAVAEAWKGYFDGPAAPFSWEPETVEVLDSGKLALSTGPVRNPQGERIGGSRRSGDWSPADSGAWCSIGVARLAAARFEKFSRG